MINNAKEKIKISEDDIKTLFHVLDDQQNNHITLEDIRRLKNLENVK